MKGRQAEGVAGRVEKHHPARVRLSAGDGRPMGDGERGLSGQIDVRTTDVEVNNRGARPDWTLVVLYVLRHESDCPNIDR